MRLHSFPLSKQYPFVPNPFFGYCTLAIGRTMVRKCAEVGDWIVVFGAVESDAQGKIVAMMCVDEVLTFDEYWEDERFLSKRPVFDKEDIYTYGDNIYHHAGFRWVQEASRFSESDEVTNRMNLKRDTQTNRVLIGTEFYYFGDNPIDLPSQAEALKAWITGCTIYSEKKVVEALVEYVRTNYEVGMLGKVEFEERI